MAQERSVQEDRSGVVDSGIAAAPGSGKQEGGEDGSATRMLLIAVLGLVAVFATDIFGIGRGRPVFVYNMLDLERFRWRGAALGAGKHTIVFDFKYDGPGAGKGGTGVLSVDGKEVDRKTIEHTIPLLMSIDETFDIGLDTRTPVDFTYDGPIPLHRDHRQAELQARAGAINCRGQTEGCGNARQSQRLSGQKLRSCSDR